MYLYLHPAPELLRRIATQPVALRCSLRQQPVAQPSAFLWQLILHKSEEQMRQDFRIEKRIKLDGAMVR